MSWTLEISLIGMAATPALPEAGSSKDKPKTNQEEKSKTKPPWTIDDQLDLINLWESCPELYDQHNEDFKNAERRHDIYAMIGQRLRKKRTAIEVRSTLKSLTAAWEFDHGLFKSDIDSGDSGSGPDNPTAKLPEGFYGLMHFLIPSPEQPGNAVAAKQNDNVCVSQPQGGDAVVRDGAEVEVVPNVHHSTRKRLRNAAFTNHTASSGIPIAHSHQVHLLSDVAAHLKFIGTELSNMPSSKRQKVISQIKNTLQLFKQNNRTDAVNVSVAPFNKPTSKASDKNIAQTVRSPNSSNCKSCNNTVIPNDTVQNPNPRNKNNASNVVGSSEHVEQIDSDVLQQHHNYLDRSNEDMDFLQFIDPNGLGFYPYQSTHTTPLTYGNNPPRVTFRPAESINLPSYPTYLYTQFNNGPRTARLVQSRQPVMTALQRPVQVIPTVQPPIAHQASYRYPPPTDTPLPQVHNEDLTDIRAAYHKFHRDMSAFCNFDPNNFL